MQRIFKDPKVIYDLHSVHRYNLSVKQVLKARDIISDFNITDAYGKSMALVALYEWVSNIRNSGDKRCPCFIKRFLILH